MRCVENGGVLGYSGGMQYWKLMPGKDAVYLDAFLRDHVVRVGFVNDPALVKKADIADVKNAIREKEPTARDGQINSWASQLHKFLTEVQVGDRVLLFDSGSRLYHVGEVKSGVRFDAEYNAIPYTRDVRWVGTVSRDALSVRARNRLGAILTLFAVHSDVQKEIKTVLDGTKHVVESPQEEEQEIREIGEEVVGKAREYLKDKILDLSWDDMQEVVAGLLRAMGYKTRVSESGPDRGKDIVASPDGFGLEEPRVHVEVKHRNGQMGATRSPCIYWRS